MPTVTAVTIVCFIAVSHGPAGPLGFDTVSDVWHVVGWPGVAAVVIASLSISITVQPLQFRLVQLLEGYWPWRWTDRLFRVGVAHHRRRLHRYRSMLTSEALGAISTEQLGRMAMAEEALRMRLPREDRLLPTALGNVLRCAEDRGGVRWHTDSVILWPRLFPLLPAEQAQSIEDEVLQLDLSARLCITWAIAAAVATALLARDLSHLFGHLEWFAIPAALILMSWLSYRGAVESALAHGRDIETTIDLHKGLILEALRFPDPDSLRGERELLELATDVLSSYRSDDDWDVTYRQRPTA